MTQESNFGFLKEHDSIFLKLTSRAEQVFSADPNTTLIKLRQFGEALAQDLALRSGIEIRETSNQASLLQQLNREIGLDDRIRNLFHQLRMEGNKANHEFRTQHREAMAGLKIARELAIWFHQSFGAKGSSFKAGPFITPKDPSENLIKLQEQIDILKAKLGDANQQIESSQELTDLIAQEKNEYATLAESMDEEIRTYESLAQESEAKLDAAQKEFDQRISQMQQELAEKDEAVKKAEAREAAKETEKKTKKATKVFELNEELTRILIDQKLIDAGWEADTQELTYSKGARPEKGKNIAISEWPTTGGQHADYVLFAGLMPIAVVEAKKQNTNVAGKIPQAERYSRGLKISSDHVPAWKLTNLTSPWDDGQSDTFKIPFVYSCNGRPYVRQLEEQSGTWFRDVRSPSNLKRALSDFHAPEGLLDQLKRSKTEAQEKLSSENFEYLKLRDYQVKAIQAVETALEKGQQNCMLAMATGTGKTRTIIGLMYRFLKAERFKRILFLVDRTSLGDQAFDSFVETPLEQNMSLGKAYNIAELTDKSAESETRIHVATVQAMVKRIFANDAPPTIDAYDCIIVDEAHRGYTLDQEMTDGELEMRDAQQYQSSYRRVLDYFDAVRIALTATPAKHTSDIFGHPVYTYSYREAVADDWLIDHEPPIRYTTLLNKNGIHFVKGDEVPVLNTKSGEVELSLLEDNLDFKVDSFNRNVIAPNFNRVICKQLAMEIDPNGNEKTMIFCASDRHADMVKTQLDEAFKEYHGDNYNEASVRKITGASDKVDLLIRQYKNERYPNIAITVDLLTTGIDVPPICHLVFMRRVRSRILYEQMVGRATRRCDKIGKTVFKIYDPVDIYAALKDVTTIKPVVKDPKVKISQLVEELCDPASFDAPGSTDKRCHADEVLDQLNQKIMRVMRKAKKKAERNDLVKQTLDELEDDWSIAPEKLHNHLHDLGARKAVDFIHSRYDFCARIEEINALIKDGKKIVISEHDDELQDREENYGDHAKPADFLQSFKEFITNNLNKSVALSVVVNRPKDLTRADLKEVKMLLDKHGYNEATLTTAWRSQTNEEIAASIIGHIRQAALGQELIPFEQRIANAMKKIYSLHQWAPMQRTWLDRIAKQLAQIEVINTQVVEDVFKRDGGCSQVNKFLGDELDIVIDTLAESLWADIG